MAVGHRKNRIALVASVIAMGAIFGFSLWVFLSASRSFEAAQSARLHELRSTLAVLKSKPALTDWDASIYLSNNAIQGALNSLRGANVTHPKSPGVVLSIEDIRFAARAGASDVYLTLRAGKKDLDFSFRLETTATLLLSAIEGDNASGQQYATFRLMMMHVRPSFGVHEFIAYWGPHWDELVSSALIESLDDALAIRVPMQFASELPLSFGDIPAIDVDGGKAKIPISVTSTLKLPLAVRAGVPLYARNGIWLIASLSELQPMLPDETASTSGDLRAQIAEVEYALRDHWPRLPDPKGDLWVWIGKKGLSNFAQSVNDRPESERAVNADAGAATGRVLEESDDIDLIGTIGVWINFKGGRAKAQLSNFFLMPEAGGTRVGVDVAVSGSASAQIHVDPGPSGGFDINSTLYFDMSSPVRATLRGIRVGAGLAASGLAIGVDPECTRVDGKVETGGSLSVGAKGSIALDSFRVRPIYLVDGVPWRVEVAEVTSKDGSVLQLPYVAAGVSLSDTNLVQSAEGIVMFTRLRFEYRDKPFDDEALKRSRVLGELGLATAWSEAVAKACPQADSWKFLIAGEAFGKNNVFVQAIVKITQAAKRVLATAELTLDEVERVLKDPGKVDDVAKATVERVGKEVERAKKEAGEKGQDLIDVFRGKKKIKIKF